MGGWAGANWRDRASTYYSEPRNHCLAPGGSEYGRYLWIAQFVPRGSRVLDVGCNCGQMLKNLARDRGCTGVGVDTVPEFIEVCRADPELQGLGLSFHCFDYSADAILDWPDDLLSATCEPFDVVIAGEVIEHAMSVRGFRLNAWADLRPGGHLIVTTPHPDGFVAARRWELPEHVRQWTRWRLEQVFGPALAWGDIYRSECGRLLSLGAVFEKQWEVEG